MLNQRIVNEIRFVVAMVWCVFTVVMTFVSLLRRSTTQVEPTTYLMNRLSSNFYPSFRSTLYTQKTNKKKRKVRALNQRNIRMGLYFSRFRTGRTEDGILWLGEGIRYINFLFCLYVSKFCLSYTDQVNHTVWCKEGGRAELLIGS